MQRYCIECNAELFGRIDKRFCNDKCRIAFHNKENKITSNFVRKINEALRINRNILNKFIGPNDKAKVSRQKLIDAGFKFKYHTHTYTTKDARIYYFVYECGYVDIGNNYFALVITDELN